MHQIGNLKRILQTAVCLALTSALQAQEPTRAAEIQQQRVQKAANLRPDEVAGLERALRNFRERKYMERFAAGYHGLRMKLGNMVVGSGFAFGPEYFRDNIRDGAIQFRASAQISTKGYQNFQTSLMFPKLAGGRVVGEIFGGHRNYGSLHYYGTGPDTPQDFHANYRLEDTTFEGHLAVRPVSHLILGESTGYLLTNVGPGTNTRLASADQVFGPAVAPGIDRQPYYLRNSIFAQWDYRDNPLGAKNGGNYVMQYTWYHDSRFNQYHFRRMDVDLQQYIGFLNKTHVIALRAKTTLTETDRGEQIPFYLQPVLGGSDDLRGYRPFRFSDRNFMVLNAEYRWEVFSGMDGAVFTDAGKVFPRRGQLNFRDLESSVGFGLRFNARNSTFLRLDVGFSHEGFQVWVKFNDVFQSRRFGAANGQPVY